MASCFPPLLHTPLANTVRPAPEVLRPAAGAALGGLVLPHVVALAKLLEHLASLGAGVHVVALVSTRKLIAQTHGFDANDPLPLILSHPFAHNEIKSG